MKTNNNRFLKTYLHRDGEDYKVEVEYHYWPASHGHRGAYGEPLEPDAPAEIEIVCVKFNDGEEVEGLTDEEEQQLVDKAFEDLDERAWDEPPPKEDIDL